MTDQQWDLLVKIVNEGIAESEKEAFVIVLSVLAKKIGLDTNCLPDIDATCKLKKPDFTFTVPIGGEPDYHPYAELVFRKLQ